MPLVIFSRELDNKALLGVWQVVESTDQLLHLVDPSPEEREYLKSIRLEKRLREWLATRILVKMMTRGGAISTLPNGKPVLNSAMHLSISHSHDLAGIVLSNSLIGMDLQGEDPKLLRIERKFTNEQERAYLPEGPERLKSLTLIWSAKEAIFKYFGEQVDFAKDIHVAAFDPDQTTLEVAYTGAHGARDFGLQIIRYASVNIVVTVRVNP